MIDVFRRNAIFSAFARVGGNNFDDQDRVMRRQRPAAFGNQCRVGHFFDVADFFHGIHDGVHVLLKGVVDTVRRGDLAGLIVHSQSAADVQIFNLYSALPERRVNACNLLDGLFEVLNVEDLAPQMKMQQLETIGHATRRHLVNHLDQFRDGDAEFRSIASGRGPFARTRYRDSDAHAEFRPYADLIRQGQHETQFRILLENRNDVFSQKLADHQEPHHGPIFVAIADEQRPIVFQVRQCRHKFRLGPALESETKRPARFEDLLNNFVKLIHLDWIHAYVDVFVFGFFYGFLESGVELSDAGAEKILKPDEQRKLNSLLLQILDDSSHVDANRVAQYRAD